MFGGNGNTALQAAVSGSCHVLVLPDVKDAEKALFAVRKLKVGHV